MSVVEPGPSAPGLVQRAQNLILKPTAEWTAIEAEKTSVGALYTGYIMILAAIPPIAGLIGGLVFGYGVPGLVTIRPSPVSLVVGAIVQYVFTLIGVYVLAFVINMLAETFGGKKDQMQALKVAAYSATAGWLAGIFGIFPPLGILALLGLYSLFLLYRGLPILMKAPMERALGYTATVVIVLIVVGFVFGMLATCATMPFRLAAGGLAAHNEDRVEGKVTVPGLGSVDLGKMQDAAKQMEDQQQALADGKIKPVSTDALKALLPESLPGGFARGEVSTGSGGVAGYSGATADAAYTRGDSSVQLSVVDMGAAGALAAMAQAFGVETTKENANGYEKAGTVDGRFTTEEVDRQAKTAQYMVIVGKRFVVQAEGTNVTIDDVKGAVNAIGLPRVEQLASAAAPG
jgi:hypothetical protein